MEGSMSRQMERWEEYGRDQFSLKRFSTIGSDVSVNTISSSLVEPRTLGQYQEHLRAPMTKSGAVSLRITAAGLVGGADEWTPCWALLEDGELWFFPREEEPSEEEGDNQWHPSSDPGVALAKSDPYSLTHAEVLALDKSAATCRVLMTELGSIRTVRNNNSDAMLCLRSPDCNYYIEAPSPGERNDWLFHLHQTVVDTLIRKLAHHHRHHRVNSLDDHFRSFTGVTANSSELDPGRFSPFLLPRRQRSASTVTTLDSMPLPPNIPTVEQVAMDALDASVGAFALEDEYEDDSGSLSLSPRRRDSMVDEFHFSTREREPPIESSHLLRKASVSHLAAGRSADLVRSDAAPPGPTNGPHVVRLSVADESGVHAGPHSAFRRPSLLREAIDAADAAEAVSVEPPAPVRRYVPPAVRRRMEEEARRAKQEGAEASSAAFAVRGGGLRSLEARLLEEEEDEEAVDLMRSASEMEYPDTGQVQVQTVPACALCQHPRGLKVGVTEEQGCRKSMEDFTVAIADLHHELDLVRQEGEHALSFYAIYDGHCGTRMAEYAAENLHVFSCEHPDMFREELEGELAWPSSVQRAVNFAFGKVDNAMLDYFQQFDPPLRDGSCCIAAILKHSDSESESIPTAITVANLGDSRAVLCRNGKAVRLSDEHNPNRPDEEKRIREAGGWVTEEREMLISRLHHMDLNDPLIRRRAEQRTNYVTISRVNGELAVSRAFGDVDYKAPLMDKYPWFFPPSHPAYIDPRVSQEVQDFQFSAALVSSEPEWITKDLMDEDSFIIIACDGLWDALDPQEAVDMVRGVLSRPNNVQAINANTPAGSCLAKHASDELVTAAIRLGTSDNVSCMVIIL